MQLCGVAVVECGRGHQPDPGMTVGVVVPVDERSAVSAGVVDLFEPGGELGPVLQGLEVRLRVGVVAGGVWPAVRLRDAEIREQERYGLARCGAPRSACNVRILGVICCCSAACSIRALASWAFYAVLDRPADDVAAEHVEDHVQVEPGPLRRALQLAHVPGPQLVGPLGEQLGLRVGGMGELAARLSDLDR